MKPVEHTGRLVCICRAKMCAHHKGLKHVICWYPWRQAERGFIATHLMWSRVSFNSLISHFCTCIHDLEESGVMSLSPAFIHRVQEQGYWQDGHGRHGHGRFLQRLFTYCSLFALVHFSHSVACSTHLKQHTSPKHASEVVCVGKHFFFSYFCTS